MIDGDEIFNTLLKDFEAHGAAAIARVCKENPLEFLKLCAAVIQEDMRINLNDWRCSGEMNR